jgi:hypothetical protein
MNEGAIERLLGVVLYWAAALGIVGTAVLLVALFYAIAQCVGG